MSQEQREDPRKVEASTDLGVPYFEVARTLMNRVTRFVTADELPRYTGFRSYFGFSEAVKEYCQDVGTTRGMRGTVVYSDTIFLDFDDAPEAAESFWHTLVLEGLGFEVWDSGGRSIHFHIPTAPMWSEHLPYSHSQWVKARTPGADMCLYQAGRIFRLPNTTHQKTMKRKVLLETVQGKLAEVELVKQDTSVKFGQLVADGDGIAEIISVLEKLVRNPPQCGERNHRFYSVACSCFSCGFSGDFALELMSKVNEDLMEDPIEDSELEMVLSSAAAGFGA
jgi:hypothetical protein